MNRRRFLGASAGAGATLIAGCSGFLGGGGDGSYAAVTDWTVPTSDGSKPTSYDVTARSAAKMLEFDDDVSIDLKSRIDSTTSYAWGDVDPEHLELEIEVKAGGGQKVPYYKVYSGSFDANAAREKLKGASGAGPSTYEGFDVYPAVTASSGSSPFSDAGKVYAVGNGVVIQSGGVLGRNGSTEQIHRVIDVTKGSRTVIDQHDGLAEAASRMKPGVTSNLQVSDPGQSTNARAGQFAGLTAGGSYGTVDGDSLAFTLLFVFEDADGAKTAPVDEYIKRVESSGPLNSLRKSVDGRVVTVEGSATARDMLSG